MTTSPAELVVEGHVATFTMSAPPLNIMTDGMKDEIERAVAQVAGNKSIRAVVITSAPGSSFCAGASLSEEQALTADTVRQFAQRDRDLCDSLEALDVPVIAAIEANCMGGGLEFALACDLRVVSSDSRFRAAGVRVGLIASTTRLTRLLGPGHAKDLVYTGRTIGGAEAYRLGLATLLTNEANLRTAAAQLAHTVASRAPLAVQSAKRAIVDEVANLSAADALSRELERFVELSSTEDHKIALEAFFSRSDPNFQGR